MPTVAVNALLRELWDCAADYWENGSAADSEAMYAAALLEKYAPQWRPKVAKK